MRSIIAIAAAASLALAAMPTVLAGSLSVYRSADQAQQHCPHDTIVWLNVATRVYYLKGARLYGHGQNSAYACKSEADGAGAHSALSRS
jgi:hypothetical protein